MFEDRWVLLNLLGTGWGLAAGSPVTARCAVGCLDPWLRNRIRLPRRHARGIGDARPTRSACRLPRSREGRFASLRDRPAADPSLDQRQPDRAGCGKRRGVWTAGRSVRLAAPLQPPPAPHRPRQPPNHHPMHQPPRSVHLAEWAAGTGSCAPSILDATCFVRPHGDLYAVPGVELSHEAGEVGFDGAWGDVEVAGDLTVGAALG